MTAELIGVLSVGVALGALIVAGLATMRTDLREMRRELTALARQQARTEGLLEGLRDALIAQNRPGD
jgi:hypothetical protein